MHPIDAKLHYADPHRYDSRSEDVLQRYVNSRCQPIIKSYLAKINRNDVVCDLGAGTLEHLSQMKKAAHIYAVEINSKMINYGLPKIKSFKSKVTILNEDATKTSIPNHICDTVWSIGLAEYLDIDAFFSEVARITKPGGQLLLQFQNKHNPHNLFASFVHAILRRPTKYYRTLSTIKKAGARHGFVLDEYQSGAFFGYVPLALQRYFIWLWKVCDFLLKPSQNLFPTGVNIYCRLKFSPKS